MGGLDGTVGAFALLAWSAYIASRVFARRHIPELVAFLLVGVAAGPSGLGLIDREAIVDLQPVTEVALGVLMFAIGERVSPRFLRSQQWPIGVALLQYVLAAGAVYGALGALGVDESVRLLLAVLSGAGAPLTISAVITSQRATGRYPDGLVATHAIADGIATVAFAAVLPLARVLTIEGEGMSEAALRFARLGLGGVLLGLALGWMIARVGSRIETSGELLLFLGVQILAAWAVADALQLSLPLAALIAGAASEALLPRHLSQRQFRVLRGVEQPLYLIFFALAGAGMHLDALGTVGLAGAVYVVVRSVAKLLGGFGGGMLAKLGPQQAVRLGTDSLPQAGVAVGLAILANERLPSAGGDVAAVILGSVVLFELVGPLLVARGMRAAPAEEAATSSALGGVPDTVLLALSLQQQPPPWLLDLCQRWHSRLVVVGPIADQDLETLIVGCRQQDVDLEVHAYRGEDWTGEIVRAARQYDADLVILGALSSAERQRTFALRAHELVARQLPVPVLALPLDDGTRP